MQINLVISRHIDTSSIVQCRMQHGDCIVLCHINLIQYTKSTVLRALVDASFSQFHLIVFKGIGSDQIAASGIDMERNIIGRSSEDPGKVLCQDVFSCRLGTGEQEVFFLQQGSDSHLQNLGSVKWHHGFCHPVFYFLFHRVLISEFFYGVDQLRMNLLLFQICSYIHRCCFSFIHNLFIFLLKYIHFCIMIFSFLVHIMYYIKSKARYKRITFDNTFS